MTRGLPLSVKEQIQAADSSPAWDTADLDYYRDQVLTIRDRYPMSDIRLAQFLMEICFGIQQVLDKPYPRDDRDEPLRSYLIGLQTNYALLSSAVSRRVRGKPEV